MADAIATIPALNGSVGEKRAKTIVYLESKLIYIFNHVVTLKNSQLVKQLLQTIEVGFPWKTRHSTCCPPLPFPPFRFLYPPAGMVFICLQAIRNYVQTILYPPLKAHGVRIEMLELESEFDELNSYEMCRAYAAIEDEFGDDSSRLLSCFRPMSVAGFSCPQELRSWYSHKLAHFERIGPKYVEPVRRYLSVMWGIPELLTMDFETWKQTSLENPMMALTVNDIDTAAKIVVIAGDSDRSEDSDSD
jgi:hypothetical protein